MIKNKLVTSSNKRLKEINLLEIIGAYRRCLYWFFSFPNIQISLSDLARNLNISKTSAREIVLDLVQEEFLLKEELGKVWRIFVNRNHFYNKTLKIIYNLEYIYLTLPYIIKEINKIISNYRAIILFGSYRKGDDDENSDLDLAVEVFDDEDLSIIELGIIPRIGYKKNIKVNIYKFSRNKIDINLFNNIANGIILEGFLEVRP